jgi:hypothetical protein
MGNLRDRGHFEHIGADGKMILKQILTKKMGDRGLESGYQIRRVSC